MGSVSILCHSELFCFTNLSIRILINTRLKLHSVNVVLSSSVRRGLFHTFLYDKFAIHLRHVSGLYRFILISFTNKSDRHCTTKLLLIVTL